MSNNLSGVLQVENCIIISQHRLHETKKIGSTELHSGNVLWLEFWVSQCPA